MPARNAKKGAAAKKTAKRSGAEAGEGLSKVPPTRATGAESATGQAIADAEGTVELPQGEDRGSTVEIVGGEPQPDALEPTKNLPSQEAPAKFVSNGQLEENMIGSPSGPVPVSTVAVTQEDADKRMEKVNEAHEAFVNRDTRDKRLDDRTVNRLGAAELRAIGGKRGYELEEAGVRTTRAAFLQAQDDDENLFDEESK